MAPPDRPASKAWLSLVGRPNRHAETAHSTMDSRAAFSAAAAPPGSEKATSSPMVSATAGKHRQARAAPAKLQAAASHTPRRKVRAPEPTAVAMALGASVHPLTKITASTSRRARWTVMVMALPPRRETIGAAKKICEKFSK